MAITGPLPASIRTLTKLKTLMFWGPSDDQKLSGPLPTWLNELTELEELTLGNNEFTGNVPDLSALTKLQKLVLHSNNLNTPLCATGSPASNPFGYTTVMNGKQNEDGSSTQAADYELCWDGLPSS